MYGILVTIVIICAGLIGYIYYNNRALDQREQELQQKERESRDKQEMERIRLERVEKQRLEKERNRQEEYQKQLQSELKPLLDKFLHENEYQVWLPSLEDAQTVLRGETLSVQELLQHNVTRRFPDGAEYKVGFVKKTQTGELSLAPDKVEALQSYFVSFLDFFAQLKSRGITIDKLQLHTLLTETIYKQSRVEHIR